MIQPIICRSGGTPPIACRRTPFGPPTDAGRSRDDPARPAPVDVGWMAATGGPGHRRRASRTARARRRGYRARFARRATTHMSLDKPRHVVRLLAALLWADAAEQARTLSDRLAAEGHFVLSREHADDQTRYRFGRELDGSPSPSWDWKKLD